MNKFYEYSLENNKTLRIKIPNPVKIPSFFVFAIYKSGSVLQHNIITDICNQLKIPIINIPAALFKMGIEDEQLTVDMREIFVNQGYCYSGFRHFPCYLNAVDLTQIKKILLVRDPRDILVSHYYSMKWSHRIATGKVGQTMSKQRQKLLTTNINDYVMEKAPMFNSIFENYEQIEDQNLKTFRYEDIIFNKFQYIEAILSFLDLTLPKNDIQEIVKTHDIIPIRENPFSHIRKVTPGDYKTKLSHDTISHLNDLFSNTLRKYNYD